MHTDCHAHMKMCGQIGLVIAQHAGIVETLVAISQSPYCHAWQDALTCCALTSAAELNWLRERTNTDFLENLQCCRGKNRLDCSGINIDRDLATTVHDGTSPGGCGHVRKGPCRVLNVAAAPEASPAILRSLTIDVDESHNLCPGCTWNACKSRAHLHVSHPSKEHTEQAAAHRT